MHTPVLVNEVLALFKASSKDTLLDCTLGLGGHAKAFLEASAPAGRVIGLDADPLSLKAAHRQLAEYGDRVTYLNINFANLKDSFPGGGIVQSKRLPSLFTYILFDLGMGSHQIADPARGFSFHSNAPLIMRYGLPRRQAGLPAGQAGLPPAEVSSLNTLTKKLGHYPEASDIVNGLKAPELAEILRHYGEEKRAWPIAKAIANHPAEISTAGDLAQIITQAAPRRGRLHPATRTFQALRLAVNRELEALSVALPQATELLSKDGVVVVISFHSLEDRIVKQYFRSQPERLGILTKKPQTPSQEEISNNPRARSAKLRAARKMT